MKWRSTAIEEGGKLIVPYTWLLPHYYEALTALFRIENALRLFVYLILKERFGPGWKDLEIASDEESKTTIGSLAKRRIEQWKTFGYLGYPIQSAMMHMTSGELVRLVTHDSYWPLFKDYFLAARNVVTLKLQEIGTIRNALAHFRPLSPGDVEVVKQNADQMLSEVERTLIDALQCAQIVPTNTTKEWYTELRTLGTDNVSLSFTQSPDERWIRISLRYNLAVVGGTAKPDSRRAVFRITNLDTPSLLAADPTLRGILLFATERVPRIRMSKELSPMGQKDVRLTFSQRALVDKHSDLKQSLERILRQLTEETELLREDQLARGKLVEIHRIVAKSVETESEWQGWDISRDNLESPPPIGEMAEFWGSIFDMPDFISDTENYPWMPVAVSEVDVPF